MICLNTKCNKEFDKGFFYVKNGETRHFCSHACIMYFRMVEDNANLADYHPRWQKEMQPFI